MALFNAEINFISILADMLIKSYVLTEMTANNRQVKKLYTIRRDSTMNSNYTAKSELGIFIF